MVLYNSFPLLTLSVSELNETIKSSVFLLFFKASNELLINLCPIPIGYGVKLSIPERTDA
jgi:hypothetical protein